MVELTRLGGSIFVLNSNLIESYEQIPETKVVLTNGKYFLVEQSAQEITDRIIEYNRKIFTNLIKTK